MSSSVGIFNPSTQKEWPKSRDLAVYNEMTGLTLEEELKDGGIMIDIGPGEACAALQELTEKTENIWAIGIAPNIPEVIPKSVTMFGGWTPTFPLPTDERARVITDIFAGVSYAMKERDGEWVPAGLDVLIRAAGWLAPGGVLAACTETRRLGDGWAHERISKFFHDTMGLDCRFEVYEKFAEGNGKIEDQLRITIRKPNTYDSLVQRANEVVGRALRGRVLWESKDESARIYEVLHPAPEYFGRNREKISKDRFDKSVTSPKPKWPDNRDLDTYDDMVGFRISDFLRDGDVYIDSGAGRTCRVAEQVKEAKPSVYSIAVGMHVPEKIPAGVTAIPAVLPQFDFGKMRIKPARLITDIFGAVSFADKKADSIDGYEPAALETLIRLALQLAPDGKLVVCTERDRFGDSFAWQRIAKFFQEEMGLKCTFEVYGHFAEDRQENEEQLRIVIESDRDFEHLLRKSEEMVGVPQNGKILWESKEDDPSERMQIRETIFEKPVK